MRTFIKWFCGLIFLLISYSIISTSIFGSILFLIAGILCIPPLLRLIESVKKKPFTSGAKRAIAIWCVLIGSIVYVSTSVNASSEAQEEAEREEELAISKLPTDQQISTRKAKAKIKRKAAIEKQFSSYDGSHYKLKRYIKKNMNDPDSYDHIETRFIDAETHLVVTTKFRGANAFGAKV